ncbi:MAG: hypothetical protein HYV35_08200 [Lentisphaerae bacterium]|nr:hypothetical protein [Lentisphaerota bacterium]
MHPRNKQLTVGAFAGKRNPAASRWPGKVAWLIVAGVAGAAGFGLLRDAAAVSFEDTVWTKYDNTIHDLSDTTSTNGRIPLGTNGKGDDGGVLFPRMVAGVTNQMWYGGNDGANYRIYYATSPDGLTWTKYDNTVPGVSDTTSTGGRISLGTAGTGDDLYVYAPCVLKDGATYKMWYTGHDGTNYRIYYATSPDGLTWTKYDNTVPSPSDTISTNGRIPLGTAGTGDDSLVLGPSVLKDGATYRMWYAGSDNTTQRIYYATSPDGLTWTKYNNALPTNSNTTSTDGRIPTGTAGKGDIGHATTPFVIRDSNTYKMWYGGSSNVWSIYHANRYPPPGTFISAW